MVFRGLFAVGEGKEGSGGSVLHFFFKLNYWSSYASEMELKISSCRHPNGLSARNVGFTATFGSRESNGLDTH